MRVNDILNEALKLGACEASGKATDWKSLAWLFFSPQGVEFCKKYNYPSLDVFRQMDDSISSFGVYVDRSCKLDNTDAAIIGDCQSELHFSGTDRPYKVILMHGAKARIYAGMYAVVKVENISGDYEVFNDGTATVL